MSHLWTKDRQKLVITLRLQTVQIRKQANLINVLLHILSCGVLLQPSSPPVHDSLAETNVTTSPHHVFVAHRNLRNLSLPASGKMGFKQSFYSLFRPDGEMILITGLKILTHTRTVSKKKR